MLRALFTAGAAGLIVGVGLFGGSQSKADDQVQLPMRIQKRAVEICLGLVDASEYVRFSNLSNTCTRGDELRCRVKHRNYERDIEVWCPNYGEKYRSDFVATCFDSDVSNNSIIHPFYCTASEKENPSRLCRGWYNPLHEGAYLFYAYNIRCDTISP